MPITKLLDNPREFEIQTYKKPEDIKQLNRTHVSFSGSPLHHPYDSDKVILLADPFSSNTIYYEFYIKDISFAEKLQNIVNPEGETLSLVRIWVKKMSLAVSCTPFLVEDTRRR